MVQPSTCPVYLQSIDTYIFAMYRFVHCMTLGGVQLLVTYTTYSTAQTQLDAHMWVAGSAPEGDISMGMQVPAGIFPVSSKACL